MFFLDILKKKTGNSTYDTFFAPNACYVCFFFLSLAW